MNLAARLTGVALGLVCLSFAIPSKAAAAATYDLAVTYRNGTVQQLHVRASSVQAARSYALGLPGIQAAEVNQRYHATAIPNDPDYSLQTALAQIRAAQAWDVITNASSITVAVLDSGVDITNPDLQTNVWTNFHEIAGNGIDDDHNGYVDDVHGWNFVEGSNDPRPQRTVGATVAGINHGTVVAGIVGAVGNNSTAGTGVLWRGTILPVRVLDSTGSGSTVTVAQGITYAVAAGAKIINLSFVGSSPSQALQNAITDAYNHGVLVVAASGNTNNNLDTTPQYPACDAHVLGVASVNASDVKSSFSNYGSCIDLSAPGEAVYSTLFYDPDHGYSAVSGTGWYGTSVASPFVVGAAALLWSSAPALTPDGVLAQLQRTSVSLDVSNPAFAGKLGAGRVDLAALFASAQATLLSTQYALTAPLAGDSPRVRTYNLNGKIISQFWSGNPKTNAGLSVASGDVNGDGVPEIITAPLRGVEPRVRVFDRNGVQLASFLVYDAKFRSGVVVAVGDVNGDGVADIVTGTQTGAPHVRIFSSTGEVLGQFFALTSRYRGGVRVAVADADADGVGDIIVASATSTPRIQTFHLNGKLIRSFLAFPTTYRGGVNVAAGDVNGDGVPEIVIGEAQGTTKVRTLTMQGKLVKQFTAYDKLRSSGVQVAVADVNGDGSAEIITGPGPGNPTEVRIWKQMGALRYGVFTAYGKKSRTGIAVSSIPTP